MLLFINLNDFVWATGQAFRLLYLSKKKFNVSITPYIET